MDSLKLIFGLVFLILCMGIIGMFIWIMLFGIPRSSMDGGTLVQGAGILEMFRQLM